MDVYDDDHQELEACETLSLTDFPLTQDGGTQDHDKHRSPPSPATEDVFEFCSSGSSGLSEERRKMSHAENMISGGKLIPIKDQSNHDQQAPRTRNQNTNERHIRHHARCESMRELKSTNNKGSTASQLFRNYSTLDSKKLNRNSRLNNYESTADMNRNSLSTKSSSARWSDLVFAPLKVPPEMDLRDIRNRQIVQNTSKSLFPAVEGSDRFAVSRAGYHRKTSWGVLGFLSCKRSGSVAVTMPLS